MPLPHFNPPTFTLSDSVLLLNSAAIFLSHALSERILTSSFSLCLSPTPPPAKFLQQFASLGKCYKFIYVGIMRILEGGGV